jgi:hypothetical protein
LDDRERRLNRKEAELEQANRLLEETLGTDDIVRTINELNQEKVLFLWAFLR